MQVRELRKLLKQKQFREIKDVQALATYELQGEYVATFRACYGQYYKSCFIPLSYIYSYHVG